MTAVDIMQSQNTSLRHPFVLDSAIEVTPGARDNAVVPREKNWLKRADGSRSRVPSNGKSYINAGFYVFEWQHYCPYFYGKWMDIHGNPIYIYIYIVFYSQRSEKFNQEIHGGSMGFLPSPVGVKSPPEFE